MSHPFVISCRGLTKRYGSRRGIESVSIDVGEGSIFGFLGPNGAGKTTAIRVLLGFLRATSGSASIFGDDCWRAGPRIKHETGYLPGDLRLYPWMTAESGLRLASAVRGRDTLTAGRGLCERLRLDPMVPVRKMSRGTRQKLGLVLALAHAPRLIILDEPTSGLDPLMQDELARLLRERAADGATVFFSSHTLGEVETLCDRIAIVRDGRIVADETLDDLRQRATREVTIRFQSASAAQAAEPHASLRLHERSGDLWRATLDGAPGPLVAWLATQPIADVAIGSPDLEGIFRSYYRRDEEAG
jgi:ABC-2 type transport system ATP-binding protein